MGLLSECSKITRVKKFQDMSQTEASLFLSMFVDLHNAF